MDRVELEAGLRAVLSTLSSYLDELVLIGGWVPYLQLRYGSPSNPRAETSLTTEADLLLPSKLPRNTRPPISEILQQSEFQPIGESGVVWSRESDRGERIEFLRHHRGIARSLGQPADVEDQPGLAAIGLSHAWVLREFTEVLKLTSEEEEALAVRVPTLGAFLLNKANTFGLRGGRDDEPRAAKDLIYLRDVMAAGDRVQDRVSADLRAMIDPSGEQASKVTRLIGRGEYHLRKVAPKFHGHAARILAEREGTSAIDAAAEVEGYARDLAQLFRELIDASEVN